MFKKIIISIILVVAAAILWYLAEFYMSDLLGHIFNSLVILVLTYVVFEIILSELVARRIKNARSRYSFRKIMGIIFLLIFAVLVIRIWVQNPQALIVSYGVLAAGAAVALQDVFKSFAGGLLIIINGLYNVGDRIEINNKVGDVIDIGILYTTVFEIRGWVKGDQPTGRITRIPNKAVLTENVNNFTKDHSFIWDEITIPLTYKSDWKKAVEGITKIAKKETGHLTESAEKEFKRLSVRYFVSRRNIEPGVFVSFNDNWIELTLRYITPAMERRVINAALSAKILGYIEKSGNIKISSATQSIGITELPKININK